MSGARVRVKTRGPLVIEGEFTLEGPDGAPLGATGATRVLLCRCAASKCRPFCDGSHNRTDFERPELSKDEKETP